MTVRWLCVLLLALSPACSDRSESVTPPTSTPPSETASQPEQEPESEPETVELPIGMQSNPWVREADEESRNAAALRLHRRGDYAEASQSWRTLVEDAPTYDMARFNLACALA